MSEDRNAPMPLRFTTSRRPEGPGPERYDEERDYLASYRVPLPSARPEATIVSPETVFWAILFAGSLTGIYLSFRTF